MLKRRRERDPIQENFDTLEEFWDFWDSHRFADYDNLLHEVGCRVNIVR